MGDAQETSHRLQLAMQAMEKVFPGCAVVLIVAPFGGPAGQRANYIGNGHRDDIRVLLKEVVARWEGRAHDAPEMKQ